MTLNLANFLSYYSANREIVASSSICITPKSKKKKISVLKTDGKLVECSACKKPFPNKSSLVSHLSNSHGNQRRLKKFYLKTKLRYDCPECDVSKPSKTRIDVQSLGRA